MDPYWIDYFVEITYIVEKMWLQVSKQKLFVHFMLLALAVGGRTCADLVLQPRMAIQYGNEFRFQGSLDVPDLKPFWTGERVCDQKKNL